MVRGGAEGKEKRVGLWSVGVLSPCDDCGGRDDSANWTSFLVYSQSLKAVAVAVAIAAPSVVVLQWGTIPMGELQGMNQKSFFFCDQSNWVKIASPLFESPPDTR